ncbi:hypothetical protein QTP88_009896 [Uroleucon formosanum]
MTTSSIENTPILIQVGNKELKISTIYKRSGIPLLASDLDSLLNTSHYTIVVIAADVHRCYKVPVHKDRTDELVRNAIEEYLNLTNTKNIFFYLSKIQNTIKKLPNQKEAGPDQLTPASSIATEKLGKDVKQPVNHRSISLLSTLDKVYKKLILNHLQYYLKNHIRPEQFGCHPDHSTTTTQLDKIIDEI